MCSIDNSDPVDFLNVSNRRAAKDHRCCECRRTIRKGESHKYVTMLYEGRWNTYRTCAHCKALGGWLIELCGGYLTEGMLEEIEEHWDEFDEYRSLALGRCIVLARDKWERNGQLVPVPTTPPVPAGTHH